MTPGIRIEIKHIAELNIKIKQGEGTNVVLAIETFLPPGDIARIYNLSKQGVPVSAVIESPQSQFDLRVEEIDLNTGQIIHSRLPVTAGDVRN